MKIERKDRIVRYDILEYFKTAQDALNRRLYALKRELQALADKYSRLDTVETGAEVNVINGVKVKNEDITTVDDKVVTIDLGDYTKNEVTEVLKAKLDGIHEFASEVVVNPQREDGVTLAHISVNGEDKFIKRGAIEYGELEHIPATFPPSEHNHDERYYGKAETESKLDLKSDITHLHDDRYYTESEADNLLSQKSDIGHTHSQYLTAGSMLNTANLQGIISVDNLPVAALERLVNVADDTARFALTEASVQLGDTVKVANTGLMYIIKDISKLNSEAGYEVYTAGSASSVPWSGVTGKPSSYTPSAHTHDDRYYTESEINTKLAGKSDTSHTHDDRYYTESEINSKVNTINSSIGTKADKTHTHDDRYYTESEIDSKLSTKSPLIGSTSLSKLSDDVTFGGGGAFSITQNNGSWWQRLRTVDESDKTLKRLIYEESQGNSGSSYTELFSVDGNGNAYAGGTLLSKNGHTHDDRYYTESEIDSKLAGKQGSLTATGSATKGMYIDSSGTAKAMTYSVNKDVPSDAKFTDTVYTHPTTAGNKHIPSGGSSGQILRWSADGTAVWGADNNTTYSAFKGATSSAAGGAGLVPAPTAGAQAKYLRADGTWQTPPDTNTTYSASNGISLSGTTFSNSGVRSIATGGSNGTISVNTNGTTTNVAVKGLGSAAYTASSAYAAASHTHPQDNNFIAHGNEFNFIPTLTANMNVYFNYRQTGGNNTSGYKIINYHFSNGAGSTDGVTLIAGTFNGALSGNATTATKATQDSAGQQINTTYIKGLSISGRNITYTKGNGTTGTITTQDTTYNFGGTTFYSGNQNTAEHNANNCLKNGHYYYTSNGPSTSVGASTTDGGLYTQSYNDSWAGQIAQDYRNGRLFVRGKNNGTWTSWLALLDSSNYNNYSPTKTGGGASGTWGINISGKVNSVSITKDSSGNIIIS